MSGKLRAGQHIADRPAAGIEVDSFVADMAFVDTAALDLQAANAAAEAADIAAAADVAAAADIDPAALHLAAAAAVGLPA